MKWMKLHTDLLGREDVVAFVSECGMAGLGVFVGAMTIIAGRMDITGLPTVTYPLAWWGRQFDLHPNQVLKIFRAMHEQGLSIMDDWSAGGDIQVTTGSKRCDGDVIGKSVKGAVRITMPNLLNSLDEYTARQVKSRDKLPSRIDVDSA